MTRTPPCLISQSMFPLPLHPPNVIKLSVPPEKTLCVGQPMECPYLVETNPLTHILEVRVDTWMPSPPEPSELVVNMLLPNEIQRIMRLISQAYMTTLTNIPESMVDRIPRLAPDSLAISCMVWNVQGAGNRNFIVTLKELVRINKPNVLVLVETHMGGAQAQKIASTLSYSGHTRVDTMGFSGGLWVYWKQEVVTVEPIIKHNQHITMDIKRVGATPWYFTAVYASPDPTKRSELWKELKDFAMYHDKPWIISGDFNDTRFPSERNRSCSETNRRSARFND